MSELEIDQIVGAVEPVLNRLDENCVNYPKPLSIKMTDGQFVLSYAGKSFCKGTVEQVVVTLEEYDK